jgi:leucyl-tRNA---protein transferase
MINLSTIQAGTPHQCPYIHDRESCLTHFEAIDVSAEELGSLLAAGWRKFGVCFFRPGCPSCTQCIPVRVLTGSFTPSESQKRVLRKNTHTRVEFKPLNPDRDIFEVYADHSKSRFGKDVTPSDMLESLYIESCPSMQSEYYIHDSLAGVGFLDCSSKALSSVYFVFRERFAKYSLGTFSIMAEIGYARKSGLPYYYLGYSIEGNSHMEYKSRFHPQEQYDWGSGRWRGEGEG